jgi:hypothetical protein
MQHGQWASSRANDIGEALSRPRNLSNAVPDEALSRSGMLLEFKCYDTPVRNRRRRAISSEC